MSNSVQVIFIGIAGPSGSGKTTYAKHLMDSFHSPLTPIVLDHFFVRHLLINHSILGEIKSWEQPECLDIEKFFLLLKQIKTNPMILTRYHRENVEINHNQSIIIIAEGYLLFALSDQITNLFDIKIFLDSSMEECRLRRFRRRNKIPENINNKNVSITKEFQQWFDHLVWIEYLKYRQQQIQQVDRIFSSSDYQHKNYEQLDKYLNERLKQISHT